MYVENSRYFYFQRFQCTPILWKSKLYKFLFEKKSYQLIFITCCYSFKWPFIRFFGIQEPASVIFSIWNFYEHAKYYLKFKKEVRSTAPLFFVWTWFTVVSFCNLNVFYSKSYIENFIAGVFKWMVLVSCLPCSRQGFYRSHGLFLRICNSAHIIVLFTHKVIY